MTKNLDRSTPLTYVASNQQAARNEERKPVLASFQVYVGTYVGPNDPGNNPAGTSPSSPAWQNGFSWVDGSPIWFGHGVDGETDMGGLYDLITGSPVSGTVAFTMPLEWAQQAPPLHAFPVRIEEGATTEEDIYVIAVQVIDQSSGDVRIYWPTYSFPYVT